VRQAKCVSFDTSDILVASKLDLYLAVRRLFGQCEHGSLAPGDKHEIVAGGQLASEVNPTGRCPDKLVEELTLQLSGGLFIV
jgi:hypothetical protein